MKTTTRVHPDQAYQAFAANGCFPPAPALASGLALVRVLCLLLVPILTQGTPAILAAPTAEDPATETTAGEVSIFDGKTLDGWKGPDMSFWTVEDGAITGTISTNHAPKMNQYLVWQGGELGDFELTLTHRLVSAAPANGGFQFRSRVLHDHDVAGYQVDNDIGDHPWKVRLYDEFGRHTLALQGQTGEGRLGGKIVNQPLELEPGANDFTLGRWHEYHLTAKGQKLTLSINGKLVATFDDQDPQMRESSGILAMQLHTGPPMKTQFKDIRLKKLGRTRFAEEQPPVFPLRDKTLVAWVRPSADKDKDKDLNRGGSALTLGQGDWWDGIVLGELAPGKWMPGSEFSHRTASAKDQSAWPIEPAFAIDSSSGTNSGNGKGVGNGGGSGRGSDGANEEWIQMALVHLGRTITLLRNGKEVAHYDAAELPPSYTAGAYVCFGHRHRGAGSKETPGYFKGRIKDARIYSRAMTAEEIASLKPGELKANGVKKSAKGTKAGAQAEAEAEAPWAWWSFSSTEAGVQEKMGVFKISKLVGGARVVNGALELETAEASLEADQR